jgi:hypothetical protein
MKFIFHSQKKKSIPTTQKLNPGLQMASLSQGKTNSNLANLPLTALLMKTSLHSKTFVIYTIGL